MFPAILHFGALFCNGASLSSGQLHRPLPRGGGPIFPNLSLVATSVNPAWLTTWCNQRESPSGFDHSQELWHIRGQVGQSQCVSMAVIVSNVQSGKGQAGIEPRAISTRPASISLPFVSLPAGVS